MSLSHSPKIVTNGLVLSVDAGNKRSFNSSENLLTYTNSIGVSGQKYNVSATPIITLNAATAPDGTLTATKIDNNGNSTSNYLFTQGDFALSTSTTYTYSIFLKPSSSNLVYITLDENDFGGKRYQLYFNLGNETVTSSTIGTQSDGSILSSGVVKYPNQWYRVYITFTTGSTTVSGLVEMISRYSTSNVGYNYFWGRQLEKGPVMTEYTPILTTNKISRSTVCSDLSLSSNNGTLINSTQYNTLNSGTFSFNGSSQYINIPDNASLKFTTSQPYSLSAWIKPKVLAGTWSGVVTKSRDLGAHYGIWIDTGSRITFGGTGSNLFGPTAKTTDWQHVTIVQNGTSKYLYVNGSLAASDTSGTDANGAGPMYIGGAAGVSEWFNGYISNVCVNNIQLSASQILQNYNALKGRYGL